MLLALLDYVIHNYQYLSQMLGIFLTNYHVKRKFKAFDVRLGHVEKQSGLTSVVDLHERFL